MMKRRRPGIIYENFIEVWEQLIQEGRAGINVALDILGGNKSTIIAFREKYEREKSAREVSLINSIALPDAVHQAIASIKVKEIDALEKVNMQLKSRIDECIAALKASEEHLAATKVDLEDARTDFEIEKLKLEKKLSAVQARAEDTEQREKALASRYEKLREQYNEARQEAAVAKKEAEMLRESAKKK